MVDGLTTCCFEQIFRDAFNLSRLMNTTLYILVLHKRCSKILLIRIRIVKHIPTMSKILPDVGRMRMWFVYCALLKHYL